ncbi:hypothetical protein dsx2_2263 [Desulfovibrio sp. X2]|uniref:hypothetical protein n=1 Tax=Desulfovibrio sp. X2 TaxID=941449 RepID=UPI0003587373|nr:hypothetical protein [Desulfovibrio sp. X2]EPR43646.1 hypothetical protein dsx2_2263 [Desulfovibrio sp. X2]
MSDKNLNVTDFLARGILIGGALGVVGGWLIADMRRGLFLGMLCGALAGLTIAARRRR